eukprot:TRINITY_DN55796_c0_g1_i1.p1 TRINITY_DN55796_c0_g1~~TRINITY_DN55796_c0_g1_i1.p1  ORF type:complete len:813 (+),score=232.56 TRINITY_DN55796_c0_g1_i1:69-2441(+)
MGRPRRGFRAAGAAAVARLGVCALLAAGRAAGADVKAAFDSSGGYSALVNGVTWLSSPPGFAPREGWVRCGEKAVLAQEPRWGQLSGTAQTWAASAAECASPLFEASVLAPDGASNAVVFRQRWPQGWSGPTKSQDDVIAAFPAFAATGAAATGVGLNYLTWGGNQLADTATAKWGAQPWGNISGSRCGMPQDCQTSGTWGGVPLLLHDSALNAAVLSPMQNPLVAIHAAVDGGSVLGAGIKATVQQLPANFSHDTVLWGGSGVRPTLMSWGAELLSQTGKKPHTVPDFVLSHLGYWTDHGGYYYRYHGGYPNAEEALLAVKADCKARNIPVRYFQWDDWWYEQYQGDVGGLIEWQPLERMFPSGMTDWLGLPLSLYMAMYNLHNIYMGDFPWLRDESTNHSLPADRKFYDAIFRNGTRIGMRMFEQDFFSTITAQTMLINRDVESGMRWLQGMDEAAKDAGITLQYCMMVPSSTLASAWFQTVTNGRGTRDNTAVAARLLPLGLTSLLIEAVGMWPSRDNVWTNETEDPKGVHFDPEMNTVVAVLAGGPYGPSDKVGSANAQLIARSCMSDGVLLRPDVPLHMVDQAFKVGFATAEPPNVWVTWSQHGPYRWTYITSFNLNNSFDLEVENCGECVAWNFWAAQGAQRVTVSRVASGIPLRLPACPAPSTEKLGSGYYVVAPTIYPLTRSSPPPPPAGGWVFMGELSKVVGSAAQRVKAVTRTDSGIEVSFTAAVGENVTLSFIPPDQVALLQRLGTHEAQPLHATCHSAAGGPGAVRCSGSGAGAQCTC